jgi:hypothetical protein
MAAVDRRRTASTIFLRVAQVDWPGVSQGRKTEIRVSGRDIPKALVGDRDVCPVPACAFSVRRYGTTQRALVIVERAWREQLAEIGPASLAREGFSDFPEFRRYWKRYRGADSRFSPALDVMAVQIHLADPTEAADMLLHRLYGFLLESP